MKTEWFQWASTHQIPSSGCQLGSIRYHWMECNTFKRHLCDWGVRLYDRGTNDRKFCALEKWLDSAFLLWNSCVAVRSLHAPQMLCWTPLESKDEKWWHFKALHISESLQSKLPNVRLLHQESFETAVIFQSALKCFYKIGSPYISLLNYFAALISTFPVTHVSAQNWLQGV